MMEHEHTHQHPGWETRKLHKGEKISEKEIDIFDSLSQQLEKAKNDQRKKNIRIKELTHDLVEERYAKSSILQNILESSIEYSIVGTDMDGKILVWNEGAHRNYGYQAAEMINKKNILALHKAEDVKSGAAREFMKRTLQNGKAEEVFNHVRKDGSYFIASVTLTVRRDEGGNPIGYVMIAKDITKAKRIEDGLIKSNEELEQFAYIASHDLKAPLRAIQRLVSWIEEDNADKLDDKSKENLTLLRQRTFRMANLIDGILHYSRAGRIDLNIELFDTKEILNDIVDALNQESRFTIHYPEYFPVFKTAKVPLIQVLSNLINNSMKHHHRKHGTIKIDIKDLGSFYLFIIEDDGPGIDAKFFDKIFEIFQTIKSRDELEATGIGLSIVKKIVESQGGKVMVQSQVRQGTTMLFTWPKKNRKNLH